MKVIALIAVAAPFLLFSAQTASAQGGSEECYSACDATYQDAIRSCDSYDRQSVDYEYCATAAYSNFSACYQQCEFSRSAVSYLKRGDPVFRATHVGGAKHPSHHA